MADPAAGEDTPESTANKPEGAPAGDSGAAARLAEAMEANRALQARLDAIEADAKAAQAAQAKAAEEAKANARREAKASGDLLKVCEGLEADLLRVREELAAVTAERDALKGDNEARLARVAERNAERVAKLPADFQALVPEGMAADLLAAHLDKLEATAMKATERPVGGRGGLKNPAPPDGGKPTYNDAFLREASRLSMPPEVFANTRVGKRLLNT